jgi:anti-sigma B factor antagonist
MAAASSRCSNPATEADSTQAGPPLEIHEIHENGCVRLSLTGELDIATAPALKDRLDRLHSAKINVRLDLSKLEFMDSTWLHVLSEVINNARVDGWRVTVEPDLSPQVSRLFELTGVDHIILQQESGTV